MAAMESDETFENYTRFLIIGGGIAGLSAASHLTKNGISDYKLLEARNRLGGRIATMQIGGSKVELGANWIHGILGNPLYELAVSNNLVDVQQSSHPHNVVATTEEGRRLPFAILQEIYEAYFWFFKRCEEYFLCKYQPPEGVKSVGQHIELEINIYLQRFPPQQRNLRRLIFDYLIKRECCITGCDNMADVDLLNIGSFTELPGGNIKLPQGYSSILSPIVKLIPPEKILKQRPVKSINWKFGEENKDGYESDDSTCSVNTVKSAGDELDDVKGGDLADETVISGLASLSLPGSGRTSRSGSDVGNKLKYKRRKPQVKVECENGEVYYAEAVVCALPLGVIQRNQFLLNPALPQEKQKSMDKMIFGVVNKIFLAYDKPFLNPDISEIIMLWNRIDEKAEKALPMSEKWYRKIYSFSKVSETVLLGWISGEEAKYLETLKMNVVADQCTNILRKFLGDPFIPKPKSCMFTSWHSQPYTLGSYTAIGLNGAQSDIEKIAEPLFVRRPEKKPVIAFAGEHCHPSFYSTAHGAFFSGRSAAQLLIRAFLEPRRNPEDTYNLTEASVADLTSWLDEVSCGTEKLEDYRNTTSSSRPRKDDGKFTTPR